MSGLGLVYPKNGLDPRGSGSTDRAVHLPQIVWNKERANRNFKLTKQNAKNTDGLLKQGNLRGGQNRMASGGQRVQIEKYPDTKDKFKKKVDEVHVN